MRAALIVVALMAPLPAHAESWACIFDLICSKSECEDPEESLRANLVVEPDSGMAELLMSDGDNSSLQRRSEDLGKLTVYQGGDFDGGAVMLSLHEEGDAIMTVHLDVFGLGASTAYGHCKAEG